MFRHPLVARLRALLPGWRLFDRAVASPRLWVRSGDGDALGPWAPIELGPRPRWSAVFAPAANLALAYQTVIDQLVAELGDLGELETDAPADGIERDPRVTSLVSYELVARIARAHLPGRARRWQWKIVAPGGEDFLIAPIAGGAEAA